MPEADAYFMEGDSMRGDPPESVSSSLFFKFSLPDTDRPKLSANCKKHFDIDTTAGVTKSDNDCCSEKPTLHD